MRTPPSAITAIACLFAAVASLSAATVLVSDDFESGFGNWSADGLRATHYTYAGVPDTNYASNGNGAIVLTGPAGSDLGPSYMELTSSLALVSGGFTDVTISFNDIFESGSSTRKPNVEYSVDGGANWILLGEWDVVDNGPGGVAGVNGDMRSSSIALTPGSAPVFSEPSAWDFRSSANVLAFTDNVTFRIGAMASNTGHRVYIDDLVISSSIPEPSVTLLGGLGILLLLRRRRSL